MKHLKTSSRDLRELFDKSIPVKCIAEPLASFDEELSSSSIRAFMDKQDYDVVGVRRNGMVYAYAKRTELASGTLQDHTISFDPTSVVSEDSPLLNVFKALRHSPQVFVLILGHIAGIVTRGDLQKAPVRMWLFGVISLVEMQFLRIIREMYPNDSWREKNLVSDNRLAQAQAILEDRKSRNEAMDLADCLQLGDKRKIVLKTGDIYKKLGFDSKKSADRVLQDLEDLRDNLAHAQDIVTGQWPHIADLAAHAESTLKQCEEITTFANKDTI